MRAYRFQRGVYFVRKWCHDCQSARVRDAGTVSLGLPSSSVAGISLQPALGWSCSGLPDAEVKGREVIGLGLGYEEPRKGGIV